MLTDFDDVGVLAYLHALADAGECEILATVISTRGNASVGAIDDLVCGAVLRRSSGGKNSGVLVEYVRNQEGERLMQL